MPTKIEIKNRLTDAVIFVCDVPDKIALGLALKYAVQNAVTTGADLRDANLRDANLTGANGNPILATDGQSIENLDKVRAIVLDDQTRLDMGGWHQTDEWEKRTCAEETLCETTHCLAGWLQVCSTVPEIRKLDAHLAGILSAPVAAKMFFKHPDEVLTWLESRAYVAEIAESANS